MILSLLNFSWNRVNMINSYSWGEPWRRRNRVLFAAIRFLAGKRRGYRQMYCIMYERVIFKWSDADSENEASLGAAI